MNKNLIKRYFFNLFGIIFSRLSGLGRDLVLAAFFGAGVHSDLFYAMLRLPQFFRSLLTEGVFNQAFLPHLRLSRRKGAFCASVFLQMLIICLIICSLVSVFAAEIIRIIAPGFAPADAQIAAALLRYGIWFIAFNFAASFFASLSNYLSRFFLPAALNSLFNIACMIGIACSFYLGAIAALKCVALCICAASLVQFLLLLNALRRSRICRSFLAYIYMYARANASQKQIDGKRAIICEQSLEETNFAKTPKFPKIRPYSEIAHSAPTKGFYRSFGAAIFAASSSQIGALVEFAIASTAAPAAITYIQMATRLYQLPLALLAIAFSQVLLPAILAKSTSERAQGAYFWALFTALIASASVGYFFADEITRLLFMRGSFSAADAAATANMLRSYIWLIVPLGLSKIFLSQLAARLLQRRAAMISAACVALNCAAILLFLPHFGLSAFGYAACLSSTCLLAGYALASGRLCMRAILAHPAALLALPLALAAALIIYFAKGYLYANFL